MAFYYAGLTVIVNSEFAPVSYIPQDILEYFHVSLKSKLVKALKLILLQPWVKEESLVLPGTVERTRRSLDDQEPGVKDDAVLDGPEYNDVYKISRQKSDPETGILEEELCMLIRVRARFTINFEAKPPSPVKVDTKVVDLPSIPDSVNGTCIMETEVAKIFMFWSGYNFTLEFIKNPEGNSYYMNRVIIQYNTKHPDLTRWSRNKTINNFLFYSN